MKINIETFLNNFVLLFIEKVLSKHVYVDNLATSSSDWLRYSEKDRSVSLRIFDRKEQLIFSFLFYSFCTPVR